MVTTRIKNNDFPGNSEIWTTLRWEVGDEWTPAAQRVLLYCVWLMLGQCAAYLTLTVVLDMWVILKTYVSLALHSKRYETRLK